MRPEDPGDWWISEVSDEEIEPLLEYVRNPRRGKRYSEDPLFKRLALRESAKIFATMAGREIPPDPTAPPQWRALAQARLSLRQKVWTHPSLDNEHLKIEYEVLNYPD